MCPSEDCSKLVPEGSEISHRRLLSPPHLWVLGKVTGFPLSVLGQLLSPTKMSGQCLSWYRVSLGILGSRMGMETEMGAGESHVNAGSFLKLGPPLLSCCFHHLSAPLSLASHLPAMGLCPSAWLGTWILRTKIQP